MFRIVLSVMRCAADEFTCGDGSCIDARRRCDQQEDCSDGSDEANCGLYVTEPLPVGRLCLLTYWHFVRARDLYLSHENPDSMRISHQAHTHTPV